MAKQNYDRYEELVEVTISAGICRIHEYDSAKRWIGGNRVTKLDISSKNPVILQEIKPDYLSPRNHYLDEIRLSAKTDYKKLLSDRL